MMLLWAAAAIPLGIYNILSKKSIALQIQPQILASLSLITWAQVMYYGHRWSFIRSAIVVSAIGAFGAALQLAGILPFMLTRDDASGSAPDGYLSAMAILSAVGLGLGVLRHYWDIYTHRSVRGISFIFVALDAAGDVTSLLSVGELVWWAAFGAQVRLKQCPFSLPLDIISQVIVRPVDVKGAVIYGVELALWIGIFILGAVFNLRAWLKGANDSEGRLNDATELHSPCDEGEVTATTRPTRAPSVSSQSSVFQTVGLRQRALKMLRVRGEGEL